MLFDSVLQECILVTIGSSDIDQNENDMFNPQTIARCVINNPFQTAKKSLLVKPLDISCRNI